MSAGAQTHRLRMSVDPNLFLDRVQRDTYLTRLAETTTAFVSLRDIGNLQRETKFTPNVEQLPNTSLKRILRAARNGIGVPAYLGSEIEIKFVAPDYAYAHQAFADMSKLTTMGSPDHLLRYFTDFTLTTAPPLTVRYKIGDEVYTAIYVPPIIEVMQKNAFADVMRSLEERVNRGEELNYDFYNGKRMTLRILHERAAALLSDNGSPNPYIPVIVDGTHRAIMSARMGTEYNAVVIRKSDRPASSVPVHLRDVVLTKSKPPRMEDRYPGYNDNSKTKGWINFKDIAVDN